MIPVNLNFMNGKTHGGQIQKNKRDTEQKLRSYAFLTAEELFVRLSACPPRGRGLRAKRRKTGKMNSGKTSSLWGTRIRRRAD
jgi:hypothetical protein